MKRKVIKWVFYSLLVLLVVFLIFMFWWSSLFVEYEEYQYSKYLESRINNETFVISNCDIDEPKGCLESFYKDVNFDGEDELIKRQLKGGQHFRDSFEVYKNGTLLADTPFNQIDSLTQFDPLYKTIEITRSVGTISCEYELYEIEDNKAKSIELSVSRDDIDKDGKRLGCARTCWGCL